MKYYVQFKILNDVTWDSSKKKLVKVIPYLTDKLGSDGIFILDGRNNLTTMIQDAFNQIERLKKICTINGFDIHRGDLKHSKVIYKSLHLNI